MATSVGLSDRPILPTGPSDRTLPARESSRDRRDRNRPRKRRREEPKAPDADAEGDEPASPEEGKGTRVDIRA